MKWSRTAGLSVMIALLLLAAACADVGELDEEAEAGDDSDVDDDQTEADDGASPIRAMVSNPYDETTIGAEAGNHLGIFDELNMDVEVLVGQDVAQALAAGDVDVGMASPNRFIGGILEGLDATIVGPTSDIWGQYVIVRTDLGVDDVNDWDGGNIGISRVGSAGHYSTEKMAEVLGWSDDDYEVVPLGDLDGLMAGLRAGNIDGFLWGARAAYDLENDGVADVLVNVGTDVIGPSPLGVMAVSNATIEERPEDVRTFCEGYYEAQEVFRNDPELATEVWIEEWDSDPEVTPTIVEELAPTMSTSDEMTDEMIENITEATVFTIEGAEDLTVDEVADMYVPCSSL